MAERARVQTLPESYDPPEARLRIDVHTDVAGVSTLAADVHEGLSQRPYRLPPKHLYDDAGSRLFDQICYTPEYYLTRAEAALLTGSCRQILAIAQPTDLVELGAGAARKTRILLDAFVKGADQPRYIPLDVSEPMLRRSACALLERYPTLRVHGVVGDYERHLAATPRGRRRLVLFLGSTIGNLTPEATGSFLRALAAQLDPGDHFLLGADLVKDAGVIERAYNDAAGLTAAFNRNVLSVINGRLGGTFDPAGFDHVALYNAEARQIEMYLRARREHEVAIQALGLTVPFEQGETIHTEISRKFTRAEVYATLEQGGFRPVRWFQDAHGTFSLALARVAG